MSDETQTKHAEPSRPRSDEEAAAGNGRARAVKGEIRTGASPAEPESASATGSASGSASASRSGSASGSASSASAEEAQAAAEGEPSGSGEAEAGVASTDKDAAGKDDALLAKGNPLRRVRGGVTAAVGGLLGFLFMAHNGQLRAAVPLGTICMLIASWGVMDLLGTFDDPEERVANATTLDRVKGPLATAAVAFGIFAASLAGAASGALWQWLWGVVVTATFLAFVAALYRLGVALGPWRTDEAGLDRPLLRRHGFWVIVAAALLYFPTMGIFSLWDPWETHYGEVAREILARDDWISLWWAQDGWFWSKPILNFWIQALAMAALGVHYRPDEMLAGVGGPTAHPEWVVRAPNVLMTILAMYLLYKGVAKVYGRRAGLIGALVLATMPDWYFLAHQTMTDMPFVAAMTSAMGLLLLGVNTEENAVARVYEVKAGKLRFGLTGWHLAFGVVLVCALPQIVYLLSRNIELVLHGDGPFGFRVHWDEFRSGSAGNCGLPGNEACTLTNPASIPRSVGPHPEGLVNGLVRFFGAFEPLLQGVLWSAVLGSVLYINWGERRVRRLYYIGAWFFAAVATMAKGPAGVAIPVICAFAYVCTKKRWAELGKLELLSGVLIILGVAIPWYVAMYVRHGSPFTDRLIFHDMFNRAFSHVHDTNEGDDTSFRFYLWQLGYALFPWSGLAPIGVFWWARRGDAADRGRGDASVFLVMWALFSFALFTFMGTKFHHYIFPAVPPIAMLIGIVLDEMLGGEPLAAKGSLPGYLLGLFGGLALLVVGVSRLWPGSIMGGKPGGQLPGASIGMALFLAGAGVATAIMAARFFGAGSERASAPAKEGAAGTGTEHGAGDEVLAAIDATAERRHAHERLMLGGALVVGALLLLLIGRDLANKTEADQPGAIRLLQLFTYNYRRPWPDSLDFSAALTGFAFVAVLLSLALTVRRIRAHAIAAMLAFSFVWAVWGLDVYMMKTSPHWGQHEITEAYYANRAGPQEPLVAYQMNWKGENFYTSNHVPAFVSSGQPFQNWLKKEKDKGTRVMYFVTEHSRTGGLRGEVNPKAFREVTDKTLCNKFVLVRAEL